VCFFNCVFVNSHFFVISFVSCQIHFDKFYFFSCTMVITVDDLDFGVKDVAFETKVLNKYRTFHLIANRSTEDPGYAYLHCDLLERAILTTITLKVKSPHIDMHEQYLQKGMFVRVKIFAIKSKSKKGFEKGDIHVVITLNQRPLCQPSLFLN